MKRTLLFVSLLTFSSLNAQLTQTNEPAIGESSSMFLCDSNYTNYANVTGSGVTWDYSQIARYNGEMRTVQVVDPTTTPNAASFTTAAKALELGTNIVTYFDSDASSRFSQGFVFTEPTLGDVIATFDSDLLTQLTYPFAYGNSVDDTYAGTIYYTTFGPTSAALAGNSHASIDGEGTLVLPASVSIANVLRLKSIDTAIFNEATIFNSDIQVVREQYEYYDLANQNLPIFIHSHIVVTQVGATQPLTNSSIILSKYTTDNVMGINENQAIEVSIYPSPATDVINIKGANLNNTSITIYDQSGKAVKSISDFAGDQISVSDLVSGIYMIAVEMDGNRSVSKFIKK